MYIWSSMGTRRRVGDLRVDHPQLVAQTLRLMKSIKNDSLLELP